MEQVDTGKHHLVCMCACSILGVLATIQAVQSPCSPLLEVGQGFVLPGNVILFPIA